MTKKMVKSEIIEITEDQEDIKQKSLEPRKNISLAYQLGYYVGEKLISDYLPTLSVDMIQTRKVIFVTNDEQSECNRLKDAWFSKSISFKGKNKEESTKKEWDALRAYHEMLEEKYLPKTLDCYFSLLNIGENDMEHFKKGIGHSLWESDCSHYSAKVEDISVVCEEEKGGFTVITLVRQ